MPPLRHAWVLSGKKLVSISQDCVNNSAVWIGSEQYCTFATAVSSTNIDVTYEWHN